MKITGFTFVRNAVIYDYPVVEAIRSVLPVCDDFVVAVGRSDDETLELIKSIDPVKIKIVETVWDGSLREGGKVLADETMKALRAIGEDTDWCFYVQGDEVVHEKDLDNIYENMKRWKDNKEVDGFLFHYTHFYGSYNYIIPSREMHPYEVRIIRNDKSFYSYRDALGFRKGENKKLNVKLLDAHIYHYSSVKDPAAMQRKQREMNKLWHSDEWIKEKISTDEMFDYLGHVNYLELFKGTHPGVMNDRINRMDWDFEYDTSKDKFSLKGKIKWLLLKKLGIHFYYKNYKLL